MNGSTSIPLSVESRRHIRGERLLLPIQKNDTSPGGRLFNQRKALSPTDISEPGASHSPRSRTPNRSQTPLMEMHSPTKSPGATRLRPSGPGSNLYTPSGDDALSPPASDHYIRLKRGPFTILKIDTLHISDRVLSSHSPVDQSSPVDWKTPSNPNAHRTSPTYSFTSLEDPFQPEVRNITMPALLRPSIPNALIFRQRTAKDRSPSQVEALSTSRGSSSYFPPRLQPPMNTEYSTSGREAQLQSHSPSYSPAPRSHRPPLRKEPLPLEWEVRPPLRGSSSQPSSSLRSPMKKKHVQPESEVIQPQGHSPSLESTIFQKKLTLITESDIQSTVSHSSESPQLLASQDSLRRADVMPQEWEVRPIKAYGPPLQPVAGRRSPAKLKISPEMIFAPAMRSPSSRYSVANKLLLKRKTSSTINSEKRSKTSSPHSIASRRLHARKAPTTTDQDTRPDVHGHASPHPVAHQQFHTNEPIPAEWEVFSKVDSPSSIQSFAGRQLHMKAIPTEWEVRTKSSDTSSRLSVTSRQLHTEESIPVEREVLPQADNPFLPQSAISQVGWEDRAIHTQNPFLSEPVASRHSSLEQPFTPIREKWLVAKRQPAPQQDADRQPLSREDSPLREKWHIARRQSAPQKDADRQALSRKDSPLPEPPQVRPKALQMLPYNLPATENFPSKDNTSPRQALDKIKFKVPYLADPESTVKARVSKSIQFSLWFNTYRSLHGCSVSNNHLSF
jgi:hypothetical protein